MQYLRKDGREINDIYGIDKEMRTGIVVIGRNEGERLRRCLLSCVGLNAIIIYVDSDSSDDSIQIANSMAIPVVRLDTLTPLSAARARNEGVKALGDISTELKYVQFIDGDCEFKKGWLSAAEDYLDANLDVTIVAGRLSERYPERSVYNRICDLEWSYSLGEVTGCGGIFMTRLDDFLELEGFNSSLIAGEEPELCFRIRRKGGKIMRISHEMALHDAEILYFWQWWTREIRTGFAYAEGMAMYGPEKERYRVRESARIWIWSIIIPLSIILASIVLSTWFSFLLAVYPFKIWQLSKFSNAEKYNYLYGISSVMCKFPQVIGQCKFWFNKINGRKTKIIEYSELSD